MAHKLTSVNYHQQDFEYDLLLAQRYTALLTLPDYIMPPVEADTAIKDVLEHSLSSVQANAILRMRTRVTQSRDSENVQRNLKIAQILRLHGTPPQELVEPMEPEEPVEPHWRRTKGGPWNSYCS